MASRRSERDQRPPPTHGIAESERDRQRRPSITARGRATWASMRRAGVCDRALSGRTMRRLRPITRNDRRAARWSRAAEDDHAPMARAPRASSTSRPTRSPTAASGSTSTRRSPTARELVAEGAAILDVGGESTRPGAEPVARRRGAAPRRARRRRPARPTRGPGQRRHRQAAVAARGARRGRDLRQRRDRASRQTRRSPASSPTRVRLLPHAHARRAAHDAARPALRRRRRRRPRLPERARRVRDRRGRRAGSASWSTPASASARRSSTTSSCCAASTRSPRSASRSSSGPRASRSWAGSRAATTRHDRVAATVATTVLALERGARVFRVHDVAATVDALAVAAATLRRR